jgi:hypothetical protein
MRSRQSFDLVAAARRSMTERGFTPDYPPQVLQELAALQSLSSLTLSPDHAQLSKIEGSLAQTATNEDPFAGNANFGLFINGTGG